MLQKLSILIILISAKLFGQTEGCDCNKLNEWIDRIHPPQNIGLYVEKSPQLIGSEDSLKLLLNNPPYPKEAVKYKKQGKVLIGFIVDTTGIPCCFEIVKGIGSAYNKAALDYLKSLKLKFIPGIYPVNEGKPVPVRVVVSVVFRMKKSE